MALCRIGSCLILAAWLAAVIHQPSQAEEPLRADFDYEVAERFAVPTIVDRGAADHAGEVYTPFEISPSSWTVLFDACRSEGPIADYRWSVDGSFIETVQTCDGFSFDFPDEGAYQVSLSVTDGQGASHTSGMIVVVEDILIVAMGDSYGSGEGVPDMPIPLDKINLANAKQVTLDSAEAALDAALDAYALALSQYTVTFAELQSVLDALNERQAAKAQVAANCPFPVIACAAATARLATATTQLIAALFKVGLSALDLDQVNSIRDAVGNLRSLAQAALDAVTTTRDAAQAGRDAARDEFNAAYADLLPEWQNQNCHRSAFSWQALAAKELSLDPHSSVTFIHLSCSGGTVQMGLIGVQESSATVAQVERARELVCGEGPCDADDREVDYFFVSIGGNDANFSSVIGKCVSTEPCFDNPILDAAAVLAMELRCLAQPPLGQECVDNYGTTPDLGETANDLLFQGADEPPECGTGVKLDGCNGLDDLPSNYAKLKLDLDDAFGEEVASRVLLTGYPQVTFDENGERCGWHLLDDAESRSSNFPGLSTSEMEWVGDVMLGSLDTTLGDAAALYGWTYVDGHIGEFTTHGYCSTAGWLVTLTESHPSQGDYFGVLHPNRSGHQAYKRAVVRAVPEPHGLIAAAVALGTLAGIARLRARERRR